MAMVYSLLSILLKTAQRVTPFFVFLNLAQDFPVFPRLFESNFAHLLPEAVRRNRTHHFLSVMGSAPFLLGDAQGVSTSRERHGLSLVSELSESQLSKKCKPSAQWRQRQIVFGRRLVTKSARMRC